MCIWLSADSHFSHANILHLAGRDFPDIEAHDDALVCAWNNVVGKDDTVYHLGDFTLGGPRVALEMFARLNGHIRVLGYPWHHDKRWLPGMIGGFTGFFSASGERVWIEMPMAVIEDVETNADGRGVPAVLCHYPLEAWDRSHYGALHFHGHSHGRTPRVPNRLDVGVDSVYALCGEYRPIRLEEAVQIARSWKEEQGNGASE